MSASDRNGTAIGWPDDEAGYLENISMVLAITRASDELYEAVLADAVGRGLLVTESAIPLGAYPEFDVLRVEVTGPAGRVMFFPQTE